MRRRWQLFLLGMGEGLYEYEWGLLASIREGLRQALSRQVKHEIYDPLGIISATMKARGPQIAANIMKNNALLQHLERGGK